MRGLPEFFDVKTKTDVKTRTDVKKSADVLVTIILLLKMAIFCPKTLKSVSKTQNWVRMNADPEV